MYFSKTVPQDAIVGLLLLLEPTAGPAYLPGGDHGETAAIERRPF